MTPQKFIFLSDDTWQFRKALSIDAAFADAVRRVCRSNDLIRACYLLDARKQEGGEAKLVLALSVKDEGKHLQAVAAQFQDMLREFPTIASNAAIMSAKRFEQAYAGAEFYKRAGAPLLRALRWLKPRDISPRVELPPV